jgi:hypothetical protein
MNGKKIIIIGLCLFMITASMSAITAKAEETQGTSDAGTTSSSAGIWYPTFGRFSYTNGDAKGNFVHFTIDESTGTITQYTVKLTFYPQVWYRPFDDKKPLPEEKSNIGNITYENKTIFTSIQINDFYLQATPNTFADYLIIQGNNTLMKCVDQEGGSIHIASSEQKTIITFVVSDGFNITQFTNDIYSMTPPPIDEKGGENGTVDTPEQSQPSESVVSPWQTIWIKSDNTTTTINSYNGTVTVNGQTIVLELRPYGYLDIYTYVEYPAPPLVNDFWYNDLNITHAQDTIEEAKRNGVISAEGWVTDDTITTPSTEAAPTDWEQVKMANSASNNYYTYDDPTFEMTFNKIDSTGVDVVVNSEISTGRIVIINVDNDILQTTSVEKLLVSFDNETMNPTGTLENLMEKVQNKDTTPSYYVLSGDQLTTLFVYVPHFSTHMISIKSLTSGIGSVSNIILPLVLSAFFICLSIGAMILQKRKQRDDF